MNKDVSDFTMKDLCACISILKILEQEEIINVDLENSKVTFNTDKTTEYLEKQNIELQERINKALEILEEHKLYLEKAKKMYIDCEDELLKSTCIQLINNELVKNDNLLKILKGDSNE